MSDSFDEQPIEYTVFVGGWGGKIETRTVRRVPRPDDVLVRITHSGLCYTDVHQRERDIALGHEGVGVVVRVGPQVKTLEVGDRVGFGMLRGVCGHCTQCLIGEDMYCPDGDVYSRPGSSTDTGSLASHALISHTYAYKLPPSLPSSHAAPFMCAGASVFGPLLHSSSSSLKAGDRVGVIGIGGLGHLAIQFAAKAGCEVVVFSTSERKKDEAVMLGASEFVVTSGRRSLEGLVEPVRHLLVVSSRQPDWNLFIPALAPRATIYPLTASPGETLSIPSGALTVKGLRVQGSFVAPRSAYAPMLAFAAKNGIRPIVQEFPMSVQGVEEAFGALVEGRVRYRAVLVADGFESERTS